jgi:cyanoexosortase A
MKKLTLVKESKFWLLSTGAGLIAIHLTLTWKYGNSDLLVTSIMFWLVVVHLLGEKQDTLNLESSLVSNLFGLSLMAWALLRNALLPNDQLFLRLFPFIFALALGLLASGARGLKQYWQELLLLGFLAIPAGLVSRITNLSTLTAKLATSLLWYLGFPVTRSGTYITLPTGSVEVDSGCSGVTTILQLLGLAFLFLAMFPTKGNQKHLIPLVASLIAFLVNGIRVALLARLVANKEIFEYWHQGQGSLIFSLISATLLGLFCYFLVLRPESKDDETLEA